MNKKGLVDCGYHWWHGLIFFLAIVGILVAIINLIIK